MVSAAKLKRAQNAIVSIRPYADRLDKMLKNILSNLEGDAVTTFGVEREINNVLIVVNTSDRGLCGAFNSNIIKRTLALIEEKYQDLFDNGQVTMLFVGKKGYEYFAKRFDVPMITDFVSAANDLSFDSVAAISQLIMDQFEKKQIDKAEVVYGKFKNAAMQFPTAVQFLPVVNEEIIDLEPEEKSYNADYIFEPNKVELLEHLVPSILQTTFQKFLLDTNASEHGARMTAMDKATENAQDLLNDLRINYNKARQEAITRELSEIVGGAAALGG